MGGLATLQTIGFVHGHRPGLPAVSVSAAAPRSSEQRNVMNFIVSERSGRVSRHYKFELDIRDLLLHMWGDGCYVIWIFGDVHRRGSSNSLTHLWVSCADQQLRPTSQR